MGYCEQFYYNIVYKTSNKLQCMQFFLNKKTGAKANRKRLKIIADQKSFPLQKNPEKNKTKIHTRG
jgi:hypothetical protein